MTSRVMGEQLKTDPRIYASRVISDSSGNSPGRIQCHLSPLGHDFLRQHGRDALEDAVREGGMLPVSIGTRLDFEIFDMDEELERLFQPDNGYPSVMSWQSQLSEQSILMEVDARQIWFKGHFPGLPVLPGVVQLHWAASAARVIYDYPKPPVKVVRLKFKKVIVPPRLIDLRLEETATGIVKFEVCSQLGVHSQGSMRFTGPAQC